MAERRNELAHLRANIEALKADCIPYTDYASDEDERESIITAKSSLESLAKSASTQQIDNVGKEVDKLETLAKEIALAMNKEEMQMQGLKMIGRIDKRLADILNTVEDGWVVFNKRQQRFGDFDLIYKRDKRLERIQEVEQLGHQLIAMANDLAQEVEAASAKDIKDSDMAMLAKITEEMGSKQDKIKDFSTTLNDLKMMIKNLEIPDDWRTEDRGNRTIDVKATLMELAKIRDAIDTYMMRVKNLQSHMQAVRGQVKEIK